MLNVLDTMLAAFKDDAIGLAAQVQRLNAETGRDVRSDFGFCKWVVRQALRDTRTPSVTIYPFTGADEVAVRQIGHADNVQEAVVAVEYFDADPEKRQDAIALIQAAVIAVLVELVDFAAAEPPRSSRIYDTVSPVITTYGEFESPPSTLGAGFSSRITLRERDKE
jgi:hypothetical protein